MPLSDSLSCLTCSRIPTYFLPHFLFLRLCSSTSYSKDQLQQKIVCPGTVTCLTASPDGLYVLAGIAEAIYLWEVSRQNTICGVFFLQFLYFSIVNCKQENQYHTSLVRWENKLIELTQIQISLNISNSLEMHRY